MLSKMQDAMVDDGRRGHIHVSATMTKVIAVARAWKEEVLTALGSVNEQDEAAQAGEQK